ncbi:MAG: CRISPR-associated helicase Cas3' [Cyanobacteria bacterium]|nr:CRISPR-associated helicase Cas3' [Cyanobacteriota bacterium]
MKALPRLEPNYLLAKSYDTAYPCGSDRLVGHTANVMRAMTLLIDLLANHLTTTFDLGGDLESFKKTARLAAYLHDWGKANDHFQGVVRCKLRSQNPRPTPQRDVTKHPQLVRHEILSMLLAWEFRDWLSQADGDWFMALIASGGHHGKLGGRQGRRNDELGDIRKDCGDAELVTYLQHPDFKRVLRLGIRQLGFPMRFPKGLKVDSIWSIQRIKNVQRAIFKHSGEWQPHPIRLAVLKSLLIAADTLGSAIARTPDQHPQLKLDRWVKAALSSTLTNEDLDRVLQNKLGAGKPYGFQEAMGKAGQRVTLVQAGCGTGKTVGAYLWAKRHAIARKLFFGYPTMGTSTEGFRGYVQGEVNAILQHSKAAADLELTATGEETEISEGSTQNEAAIKLASFEIWESKFIICTVDTVLGLLQCHRRPLYCFPAIASAAFVFDEVHSYDRVLFGALLRFLQTVKAPVLLMSASFTPNQIQQIEAAVGESLEIIAGDAEREMLPRYRFCYEPEHDWEALIWGRVESELTAGGKVLWVCNQVSTAITAYEKAIKQGFKPLLYHSRFRYCDRKQRHEETVNAFKGNNTGPVLAIATQVAEMSLDLSATLLISQIADPAALVQRLGRLNRGNAYCGRPLDAYFYDDPSDKPYDHGQLERGQQLVRAFGSPVSQADLAHWLENHPVPLQLETDSIWLDGHWRTYPGSLRDESATVTVLLEQDMPLLKQQPKLVHHYTVPILGSNRIQGWDRFRHYPIAPSDQIAYDSAIGARPYAKVQVQD